MSGLGHGKFGQTELKMDWTLSLCRLLLRDKIRPVSV